MWQNDDRCATHLCNLSITVQCRQTSPGDIAPPLLEPRPPLMVAARGVRDAIWEERVFIRPDTSSTGATIVRSSLESMQLVFNTVPTRSPPTAAMPNAESGCEHVMGPALTLQSSVQALPQCLLAWNHRDCRGGSSLELATCCSGPIQAATAHKAATQKGRNQGKPRKEDMNMLSQLWIVMTAARAAASPETFPL